LYNEEKHYEWLYLPCPRIVSDEKWDAVNTIIREIKKNSASAQPLNKRVHLFTGYLFCAQGHKMSIKSKSYRYTCKHCKYGIHKDDIEDIFLTRIKKFLLSDDELSEYNITSNNEKIIKEGEIEFATNELEKIEKKMDKLIELNIADELPTKGFKKHYNPLFERKEQLLLNIQDLESQLEYIKNAQSSFKFIANKSLDFYKKWSTLERSEKRYIVETITNRIDFDNKTINFNLKQIAPLSSLELPTNGSHRGIM
jgi:site-specific DNA recombinase